MWKSVGEAYIHGMISGEIDDIDVEERDIVLVQFGSEESGVTILREMYRAIPQEVTVCAQIFLNLDIDSTITSDKPPLCQGMLCFEPYRNR
jgi:hypothetical protein